MNKIILNNNSLNNYSDEFLDINNNIVTFKKDNNYIIEYNNCNLIELQFNVKENINITIFEQSISNNLNLNNEYNIKDNSSLLISKFYNNNSVEETIEVNLNGINSNFEYYFSNICLNKENYKIIINHNNKNTKSNIQNKLLTINDSYLNMDLDSNLDRDKVNCILNQDTKVIFFGENNVSIRPNMYIENNDVEAKHSSVISRFSEEEIFYLQSRGISYNEAIKLLVKGYIFSNLKISKNEREKITEIIRKFWR